MTLQWLKRCIIIDRSNSQQTQLARTRVGKSYAIFKDLGGNLPRYNDTALYAKVVWIQWNLSVTTTFIIKFITCDFFSNVF